MTAALILRGYPEAGTSDARRIVVPPSYEGLVEVYDETDANVTSYLVAENILRWSLAQNHGWVAIVDAELRWKVTGAYFAMSTQFKTGETPILFARVVDSLTNEPLTTQDVDSISLTIYSYSSNNIRSSAGTGYTPVENWGDVALAVSSVVIDSPRPDPRVSFVPNLVYEPNTLANNPFDNPGQYRAMFVITPTEGNRIPVAIDFRVS